MSVSSGLQDCRIDVLSEMYVDVGMEWSFNAKKLIEDCGGPQRVYTLLDGAVPLNTIHKWSSRDSMRGCYVARLALLLEQESGQPISFVRYFTGEAPCPSSSAKSCTTGGPSDIFD